MLQNVVQEVIQEVMESRETTKRQGVKLLFFRKVKFIAVRGNAVAHVDASFDKVINFMERQLNHNDHLNLYFAFRVFDFKTLTYLFRIFKMLNMAYVKGKAIQVFWSHADNPEMIDAGLELKTFCDFPFEIIGIGGFSVSYWSQAS